MSQEILEKNYKSATQLYSSISPSLVGKFTLSLEDSEKLPLDLAEIYGVVHEEVDHNQEKAKQWAKTFGALSVNIALDKSDTSFVFESPKGFKGKNETEMSTLPKYTLKEQLSMEEQDSPVTYLIAKSGEKPIATELALIQALHLVDASIMTNQFDGRLPLVRLADDYELIRLQQEYPETLLRLYGNSRNIDSAPKLLGSVISTTMLETSNIETESLNSNSLYIQDEPISNKHESFSESDKPEAVFIGVTTTKRPHIGHGFLIAKAIAESRERRVLIELNDQGPRVDDTIRKLAEDYSAEPADIAEMVTKEDISITEIEKAYRSRGSVSNQTELPRYSLTSANKYYKMMLESIKPDGVEFVYSADSDQEPYLEKLKKNSNYRALLGNSGMSVITGSDNPAVLVESKGRLEVPGIIASLASKFNLKLADSPPPITKKEQAALYSSNIVTEQNSGIGMMIDFKIASGSSDEGVSVDSILDFFDEQRLDKSLFLPTIRQVMDDGFALPGEKGSYCINFASHVAFQEAMIDAISKVKEISNPEEILYRQITYKNVLKDMLKELTSPVYSGLKIQGKISIEETRKLIKVFPILKTELSSGLIEYVRVPTNEDIKNVPRNLKTEKDNQQILAIRNANPRNLSKLIARQSKNSHKFALNVINKTSIGLAIQKMGYNVDNLPEVLERIADTKGLFKIS